MKLSSAEFVFVDKGKEAKILFLGDCVTVYVDGLEVFVADNRPEKYGGRPYKPCVSHCLIAYRLATQKKQSPDHARAAKKLKPKLELYQPARLGET